MDGGWVRRTRVGFSPAFKGISGFFDLGWGQSSKGGARELPGPVLTQLKSDSEFCKEIRTKEPYRKLTLVGKSTILRLTRLVSGTVVQSAGRGAGCCGVVNLKTSHLLSLAVAK